MFLSGDLSRTSITSARLTLKAFTEADAVESFVEANDRVARYMSWNPPESEDAYRAIWQGSLSDMKMGRQLSLTIRLRGHERVHRFGGPASGRGRPAGDRPLDQGGRAASRLWP
jgi:RimJ/RimL family protein N-acetyltransferase